MLKPSVTRGVEILYDETAEALAPVRQNTTLIIAAKGVPEYHEGGDGSALPAITLNAGFISSRKLPDQSGK